MHPEFDLTKTRDALESQLHRAMKKGDYFTVVQLREELQRLGFDRLSDRKRTDKK